MAGLAKNSPLKAYAEETLRLYNGFYPKGEPAAGPAVPGRLRADVADRRRAQAGEDAALGYGQRVAQVRHPGQLGASVHAAGDAVLTEEGRA